jgi:hypothetical protein
MLRNIDIQESPLVVSTCIDTIRPLPRYIPVANEEIYLKQKKNLMKALVESTSINTIDEHIKSDGWLFVSKKLYQKGNNVVIAE